MEVNNHLLHILQDRIAGRLLRHRPYNLSPILQIAPIAWNSRCLFQNRPKHLALSTSNIHNQRSLRIILLRILSHPAKVINPRIRPRIRLQTLHRATKPIHVIGPALRNQLPVRQLAIDPVGEAERDLRLALGHAGSVLLEESRERLVRALELVRHHREVVAVVVSRFKSRREPRVRHPVGRRPPELPRRDEHLAEAAHEGLVCADGGGELGVRYRAAVCGDLVEETPGHVHPNAGHFG